MDEKDIIDNVAFIVHKLKTPTSSIKIALEMLLEGDFGELNEEQKKVIKRTYQRNNTLISFINDLLNLDKIESKSLAHNLKRVDFEELIKSVIDCEQEEIKKRGIKIIIEKPAKKMPLMKFDKEKVFLAIQNIFNNAVKYSKIGGEIIISFSSKGKNLEIKIKDFGIGIPNNEKDKLFTKFFRCKNAIEVESIGSGLGLYIAKDIIEGHQGKIWFESEENKGSIFFVSLPIK